MSTDQKTTEQRDRTAELRESYDLYHIELADGERILEVTSDHFMEVIPKVIGPLSAVLVFVLLMFIRTSGLVRPLDISQARPFDPINIFLMLMLGIIFLAWIFAPRYAHDPKRSRPGGPIYRWLLVISGFFLLAIILIRSQGTRIFPPGTFAQPPATSFFDTINVVLFLLSLFFVAFAIYIYIESENDHLILTNHRVILSDRQVLGNYQIDQIDLEDVQNVISTTKTYFQHWLGYGTVTVDSVRKRLVFRGAERAKEVQRRIQAQLNEVRAKKADYNFKEMIDTGVYGQEPTIPPPQIVPPPSTTPRLLSWLLPENPVFNPANNTLIWHPHWIFLPLMLLPPVGALVLVVLFIVASVQFHLFSTGLIIAIGLLLIPICVGWFFYNLEDHINDVYILSPTNVIDVEKLPLGPEDRRSASIGAVQNVTTKTTLISRWLGFGDVFLETAGRGEFTFHNVPMPRDMVRMINTYQDNFRRGEKERAMKDTITLLRYYHDAEQARQEEPIAPSGQPRRRPSPE